MTDFLTIPITVHSRIRNEDADDEINDLSLTGKFRPEGAGWLLLYREMTEGGDVLTEVRRTAEGVTVRRRGAVASEMRFGPEPYHGIYEIPPFRFDMTVETESLRDTLGEPGGTLALHYRMTVGGAEKNVSLRISRGDED